MQAPDAQRSRATSGLAAVIWWSDRVAFIVAVLSMFAVQFSTNSTVRGLLLGFALGLAVWMVYSLLKIAALIVSVRVYGMLNPDQDVTSICDRAFDTEDYDWAIAQLQDLMARRGVTFARLLALAVFLLHTNKFKQAMAAADRAKALAKSSELWRAELVEAECLRATGRIEDALALTSRLMEQEVPRFNACVVHAKVMAELGDQEAADEALQRARRLNHSLFVRLSAGRKYAAMMQNDLRQAEEIVANPKDSQDVIQSRLR